MNNTLTTIIIVITVIIIIIIIILYKKLLEKFFQKFSIYLMSAKKKPKQKIQTNPLFVVAVDAISHARRNNAIKEK